MQPTHRCRKYVLCCIRSRWRPKAKGRRKFTIMASIPPPLIRCLLPEYKDEHVWWLILQYLRSADFKHTASAFCLELSCRGVPEESYQAVSEVRRHYSHDLNFTVKSAPEHRHSVRPRSSAGRPACPFCVPVGAPSGWCSTQSKRSNWIRASR